MALKEVCIAARTFGEGRAQEGDIIVIREPLGHVGTQEQNDFIWLLVDESELPDPTTLRSSVVGRKFAHRIDLNSLDIDVAKARDPQQKYQPFITVGERGRITAQQAKSVTVEENK